MDPVAGPSRIPDGYYEPGSATPAPAPPRTPRLYHDDDYDGVRADDNCGPRYPNKTRWEPTGHHCGAGRPCLQRREHSRRRKGTRTTTSSSSLSSSSTRAASNRRGGMPASGSLGGVLLLSATPYILVAPHLFQAASAAPHSPMHRHSQPVDRKGKGRAVHDDRDRGSDSSSRDVLSPGGVMIGASSPPPTHTFSAPSKRQVGAAAAYSSGIIAE